MNTAGKHYMGINSGTKSANLDIFSKRNPQQFNSVMHNMNTPITKENEMSIKGEENDEEIMKFSTMKTLMGRVRMLIRNYLEDDNRIENLEESLSLLKLGEKVCDEEINERERISEEDYLNLRERFEIQLKRIEDLEGNVGINELIGMRNNQ